MKLSDREVDCAEVLLERDRSQRSVAEELGVDESTLRYRLGRRRSQAGDGRKGKAEACEAYAGVIEAWLEEQAGKRRPESVSALYDRLVAEHGFRGTYKSVQRYVGRRWRVRRIRPSRRVETKPGAQAQVDWVLGPPMEIEELGGSVQLPAFIMTLSHSRMWWVVWSRGQDLLHWLEAHNRALRGLGGVPATVRIDNLKTGVASGAGPWASLQEGYASYAKQVGFEVNAARVRQAQDKGKVERRGLDTKWGLIGPEERFRSVAELQACTERRILQRAGELPCPVTGMSIHASWQWEQAALGALPGSLPEPFDVQVARKVGRDCTIHFEGRRYSVPFRHAHGRVQVRGCAGRIEIYAEGEHVATFPRGTACRELIDQSHYEGESTPEVAAPTPLGAWGREHVVARSWELVPDVSSRGIEQYERIVEANG